MLTSGVGSQASDGATANMAWPSTALESVLSLNYRSLTDGWRYRPRARQVGNLSTSRRV